MARILLIEDSDELATAIAAALRTVAHTVIEVPDGRQGLHRHADYPDLFDLVICDLILPEFGGIDAIRRLRARSPGLPIIAMSGATDTLEQLERSGEFSGLEYLAKPFPLKTLLEAVDRLLQGVRRVQGAES